MQNIGKCIQKAKKIRTMLIHREFLRARIQHMKNVTFIGKFVGICPSEKYLLWWINVTWKSQAHFDLHLGVKGFFTMVFLNLEHINYIFEGGSYFFNSTSLFIKL